MAPSDRFCAALNPELLKENPIVTFNRIQRQKEPFGDLAVAEAQGDEPEDLELAWAQWLIVIGIGRVLGWLAPARCRRRSSASLGCSARDRLGADGRK